MASNQGHEQDNRSGHNISSMSCQRCEGCDAHYYWCHLDDTQKYFFKCMVGDFQEKMILPEKFVENFNGGISELIKLEAPDGNKFDVRATRDVNKIVLGSGWTAFATFYELKEGCVLVFRYSGDSHFRVLIFDYPSCCEKEVFHIVMNCGPNAQEKYTRLDQSPLSETRCENGRSGNGESRQRCGHCNVHFYWHHLDDMKKHFMRIMTGDFQRQMSIPEKFVKNFRCRISELIKLEAPDGKIYDIQVIKSLNKIVLGSRWAAFANAYVLKQHDLLVFRYHGDSHFKVLIFDPSGCEKQLFHVVMNHATNEPDRGISHHQPFPGETRRQDVRSGDTHRRKIKKTTLLDPPSPRSAEGVASETMSSGGLRETTEPCYILETGCNLTTEQKADIDALVKKIRPTIPFYITAIDKKNLSGSLVFCKAYAAKYLPHEDIFITLCHPQKSNIWLDNLKVLADGASMLSVGWSCFVRHNELRESDICAFEVSRSNGEETMVVHTLEGGHQLRGKEPESQNEFSYPAEGEETEEEEIYKEHAESNYYYPMFAKGLTGKEQEEIFRSVSIKPGNPGNPVYVAILRKYHLSCKNTILIISKEFVAMHLVERFHDILLLRPNRKAKWLVKYYQKRSRGFSCRHLTKFVSDNKLHEGDVCVFELLKAMSKVTMMVHVFRKIDGKFILLD